MDSGVPLGCRVEHNPKHERCGDLDRLTLLLAVFQILQQTK